MGAVPVIDLRGDRDAVARRIDVACTEIGFFQIVGHGLDVEVEEHAWRTAHEFFALPTERKLAVAIPPGDAYGYGPFGVERLAASLGADTPPDLKETFSIGPFEAPSVGLDDDDDGAATFVFSPNRWPSDLPAMEGVFRAYYDALAALVEQVMAAMAVGLGLDQQWFEPFVDRHTSALRVLHYPDLRGRDIQPGQLRAGAHSDYGTLTLLRQDAAHHVGPGLQVLDVHDTWHDVPPVPGAYVVNVGDALARWTNDHWRSTVHRVVVPPPGASRRCDRHSIAFFHNANWDARIECIPTCLADGATPRYEPVLAGQHLMQKFRSTQPARDDGP